MTGGFEIVGFSPVSVLEVTHARLAVSAADRRGERPAHRSHTPSGNPKLPAHAAPAAADARTVHAATRLHHAAEDRHGRAVLAPAAADAGRILSANGQQRPRPLDVKIRVVQVIAPVLLDCRARTHAGAVLSRHEDVRPRKRERG